MKRILLALCGSGLAIVFSVSVGKSQAGSPGSEHKRLAVILGSWSVQGEFRPGNGYGVPSGKVNAVERSQWMPGELFVQMNREGKGPLGAFRHSIIFGYDPAAKNHTGQFFDFTGGGSGSATIEIAGNTWNWSFTGRAGDGKPYRERCTVTFSEGGASFATKCETSADGKTWSASFDARAVKSK